SKGRIKQANAPEQQGYNLTKMNGETNKHALEKQYQNNKNINKTQIKNSLRPSITNPQRNKTNSRLLQNSTALDTIKNGAIT
ncbi:hypothetical protein NP568_24730, partial [Vibrio parahaemolyticus]|nr:hypothetical protein [Vibrio parahaemolyticus]